MYEATKNNATRTTIPHQERRKRKLQIRTNSLIIGFAIGVMITCIAAMFAIADPARATDDKKENSRYTETQKNEAVIMAEPGIKNLLYIKSESTEPAQLPWQEPAEQDVEMLAKLIWGEARGVKTTTEKAAVVWCVLNRVDSAGFPNTIEKVVTQPRQFVGYAEEYPATEENKKIAKDVLNRWYAEKAGHTDIGRVLPKEYTFFTGDGKSNYFTSEWKSQITYDWSLPSPYEK